MVLIKEPSKFDSPAQAAKEVVELAHTLDIAVSNITLFGPEDVRKAAGKVWDTALACLQAEYQESNLAANRS